MKIELRNIKHAAFFAGKGPRYSATLLINGKAVASVHNDGYGGPNQYLGVKYPWFDDHLIDAADAWCRASTPPDGSLEQKCADLLREFLANRTKGARP